MLQLREIRKRRGMTVRRLAALIDVPASRVYSWESGRAEIPLHSAMLCADVLRCSLDELAGRETPPMSDSARMVLELYERADATGRAAIDAVAHAVGPSGVPGAGRRAG